MTPKLARGVFRRLGVAFSMEVAASRYYRTMILYGMAIRSFANKEAKQVYERKVPRGFSGELAKRSRDKLILLDLADDLEELRVPPGNRLEKLKGDREGQHSIRINAQWRVCFRWEGRDAHEVEIADYHK